MKHCLDCDQLSPNSRCNRCARTHANALSLAGSRRRGSKWNKISLTLRQYWALQGRSCINAWDGCCNGRIQVDHVSPGSSAMGYSPLCAYHNQRKGNR